MKVLRLSTHPSKNNHGVGLHSSKIAGSTKYNSIFLTPNVCLDTHLKPVGYKLITSSVLFKKRPVDVFVLVKIIFHLERLFLLLKFSLSGIRQLYKQKITIVHIHSPMYSMVAMWAKLLRIPTCVTYHGTDYLRVKDSKFYKFISNKFIDKGFCISPHMMPEMKHFHKEVEYIYNGLDFEVFKNNERKRSKIIFAVGALKAEKAYVSLIEAFKVFSEIHPEYTLEIAGEGPLKSEILKCIKNNNLVDKVFLLGHLNKTELVNKYNQSEVFVLSSNSEGFPKVILEALFCGCKVISTDVGSVSSFLPKKYIISSNTKEKLKSYLSFIVKEDKMEVNLDEYKKTYSWENVLQKYEKAYDQLTRSKK